MYLIVTPTVWREGRPPLTHASADPPGAATGHTVCGLRVRRDWRVLPGTERAPEDAARRVGCPRCRKSLEARAAGPREATG